MSVLLVRDDPLGRLQVIVDHAAEAAARLAHWRKSAEFEARPNYSGVALRGVVEAPEGVNPWRHAGYDSAREGWCSRPSIMRNVFTGEWHLSRCGSARPSVCAPCAEVKRMDIAAIGRSGWTDRLTDRGYWCALTAPGKDKLPFDLAQCRHSSGVKCSGKDHGCVVEADALARWHAELPMHWMHFMTALRKLLNPGLTGPPSSWPIQVEYFKTYEPQDRGALHAHFMVRVSGVVTHTRFVRCFVKAARQNDFGPVKHCEQIDLSDERQVARKAGYCAKYSTKCADVLPTVRRLSAAGEVTMGGIRSWSASRKWGDSMKLVHARRCQWARGAAGGSFPDGVGVVPGAPGGGAALDLYQESYAREGSELVAQPFKTFSSAG